MTEPGRVLVVADDLIWSTRLAETVKRAGAVPAACSSGAALAAALAAPGARPSGAIVDLWARRYDGAAAIRSLVDAGVPVIAVAEHDDQPTRTAALAAGASRVYSYNKLFGDGVRVVTSWLGPSGGGQ